MRVMRFAAAMLLSLTIAGCAGVGVIRDTWTTAQSIVVSKKAVIIAVSLSRAAERTGTAYIQQKRCPVGVQRPTCMSPEIRETIATAMVEMRKARDKLLDFIDEHPCPTAGPCTIGAQGLYDALRGTIGTLKSILTTYKIGG